ncbi:putative chemotaxis transducer [Pseudomonas aeruginosa]|nr:putative chemotaxis transducer [Pseudomonas aeruginosa]
MASAFNAMQAGYQRIVGTVAAAATKLDEGAQALARSMGQVRQGMLGQQSETGPDRHRDQRNVHHGLPYRPARRRYP